MTNQQEQITPPPELLDQWCMENNWRTTEIATQAARWGADQELEACCLLLDDGEHAASYGCHDGTSLRNARRPKLPSLKEEARQIIDCLIEGDCLNDYDAVTLRRALEALPND
jgi:hypothetical protein